MDFMDPLGGDGLYGIMHLLFTKGQNFALLQIENLCKRQNKCDSKIEYFCGLTIKHCGKRRKCWFPVFSSFFPHNIFYHIKEILHHLSNIEIVVGNCDPSREKGPYGNAKSIDPGQPWSKLFAIGRFSVY